MTILALNFPVNFKGLERGDVPHLKLDKDSDDSSDGIVLKFLYNIKLSEPVGLPWNSDWRHKEEMHDILRVLFCINRRDIASKAMAS